MAYKDKETKICKKCKKLKSLNDFHIHKGCKDNHRSDCKECRKTPEVREWTKKYYKLNKEKIIKNDLITGKGIK